MTRQEGEGSQGTEGGRARGEEEGAYPVNNEFASKVGQELEVFLLLWLQISHDNKTATQITYNDVIPV